MAISHPTLGKLISQVGHNVLIRKDKKMNVEVAEWPILLHPTKVSMPELLVRLQVEEDCPQLAVFKPFGEVGRRVNHFVEQTQQKRTVGDLSKDKHEKMGNSGAGVDRTDKQINLSRQQRTRGGR